MINLAKVLLAIEKHAGKSPTTFQIAIINQVLNGSGHSIVRAVPGSGKSTTLEFCCVAINAIAVPMRRPRILCLAFGTDINKALVERMAPFSNVSCRTLNGIGFKTLMGDRRFQGCKLESDKTDRVLREITGFDTLDTQGMIEINMMASAISKLIGLFKSFGYDAIRPFPTEDDVMELCDRYDIDLPDPDMVRPERFLDTLFRVFHAGNRRTDLIDFNDQLFLPIYWDMTFETCYQHVFIDESQDLNLIQVEMIRRIVGSKGRSLFVGDENQAIYGFRGADPEAMMNVAETFATTDLPLSICWRCSKAVVAEAAKINPTIQPAPNAIEGTVMTVSQDDFIAEATDGDMVLCRTTAPLVEHCFDLIREGKKASIKGTDIGNGLKGLLDKITRKKLDGRPWDQIETYRATAVAKIKDENKRAKLGDRLDTLLILAEGCETMGDVKGNIMEIFSDKKKGITLSTIHKAKGLEANRVFILHPELLPHPLARKDWERKQETNLEFVAITRAMDTLCYVRPDKPVRFGKSRRKTAVNA